MTKASLFLCNFFPSLLSKKCYMNKIWVGLRCLIYTVLVMQMARWCLLMLPVHKEFQVSGNSCNFPKNFSFCCNIIWWKNCLTVVEQVTGKDHVLNHLSIPAACFTHPELSMVGLTEVYHNFILFDVSFTATIYNEWVLFYVWLTFSPFFFSILFSLYYLYIKISASCPSLEFSCVVIKLKICSLKQGWKVKKRGLK